MPWDLGCVLLSYRPPGARSLQAHLQAGAAAVNGPTFSLAYDNSSKPGRITQQGKPMPPGAEFVSKAASKNAKKRANKKAKAGGEGGDEEDEEEQAAAGPGSSSSAAVAALTEQVGGVAGAAGNWWWADRQQLLVGLWAVANRSSSGCHTICVYSASGS